MKPDALIRSTLERLREYMKQHYILYSVSHALELSEWNSLSMDVIKQVFFFWQVTMRCDILVALNPVSRTAFFKSSLHVTRA